MVRIHAPSAGAAEDTSLDPWVGKIPWKGKWQPTPVFLPGESHGQRGLVGCSPWGLQRIPDMTESAQHARTHSPCAPSPVLQALHHLLWSFVFRLTEDDNLR